MRNSNRRQTLVVDPRQQLRMLAGVALIPAGIVLATGAVLAWVYLEADAQLAHASTEAPDLLMGILGAICFLFAAVAVQLLFGLRTSHRLFGPAHRITQTFEAVQQGKLDARIKLRDGDHLVELAERLNGFLAWLETHPPQAANQPRAAETPHAVDAAPALPSASTTQQPQSR